MRKLLLAAGVAASLSFAGAAHAGRAPIVIVVPRAATPVYTGIPASISFEIAPPADGVESGALTAGAVVSVRKARPSEAVVLTEALDDHGVLIPAGTVMVSTEFVHPPKDAPKIWCAVREMPLFHGPTEDCLSDPKGTGKLYEFRVGYLANAFAPFSLIGIGGARSVNPVAYRPAKPEEIPAAEIGYQLCAGQGDGEKIPWRFTTALKTVKGGWLAPLGACPFGDWPDPADKSLETVDAIKLQVQPGPTPRYQVVSTLNTGPIAPFRMGEPLLPKGALDPETQRAVEAAVSRPLIATGPTESVASGQVKHGDTLAVVPVVHGVTGVLKNEVRARGLFSKETIPAGQYVFGIPMSGGTLYGPRTTAVTWCAPRLQNDDPTHISTVCFPGLGSQNVWLAVGPALMLDRLMFTRSMPEVVGLSVERKPAEFAAPMKLAYVFDQWVIEGSGANRVMAAQIGVEIRVKGVMTPVDHIRILPGKDKAYRLPLMGGMLTFTPVEKAKKSADMLSEFQASDPADAAFDKLDKARAAVTVTAPMKDQGVLPLAGSIAVSVSGGQNAATSASPALAAATPSAPAAP